MSRGEEQVSCKNMFSIFLKLIPVKELEIKAEADWIIYLNSLEIPVNRGVVTSTDTVSFILMRLFFH